MRLYVCLATAIAIAILVLGHSYPSPPEPLNLQPCTTDADCCARFGGPGYGCDAP